MCLASFCVTDAKNECKHKKAKGCLLYLIVTVMCEVALQSKLLFSIGGIYSTTHDEDYIIYQGISPFFSLTELEDIASSVVMSLTVKYITTMLQ